MAHKPVLGKGLASLLPSAAPTPQPIVQPAADLASQTGDGAVAAGLPTTTAQVEASAATAVSANRDRVPGISMAVLDEIEINPFQPRREFDPQAIEELAQSIRANGIIQPLVVRRTSDGKYQLIAGERRMRAAKAAGLKQVPIVIRKSTDKESLELALIENIQRQNLNCVDEAMAYFQLMQDFSMTHQEIAEHMGKDRASIANHLRILRLPEAILDDLKREILSFGHGKALLSLEDNDLRLIARAQVVEKRLSVRDTEALVEKLKQGPAPAQDGQESTSAETPIEQRLKNIAQDLTRHWSTKVEVRGTEKRGRILIHYHTREELERLLSAMQ